MKKLVALFSCIFVTSVYAQNVSIDKLDNDGIRHIIIDKLDDDGIRHIMTTSKVVVIDWKKFYFRLKYEESNSSEWYLVISSFHFISKSAELLLKLGNGEIVYLPCINVYTGNIEKLRDALTIDIPPIHITTITPRDSAEYYSSIYDISPEIIDKIKKYGISKIRISSGTQYYDQEFSSENRLGNFLVRCRNNIQKRLNKTQKKKGVFDDF